MGLLDDAIREHLELKRRRGADPGEVAREQREVLDARSRDADGPGPDVVFADTPVAAEAGDDPRLAADDDGRLDATESVTIHDEATARAAEEGSASLSPIQETAEIDMQTVLEDHDGEVGDEHQEDPLEWEVPGEGEDRHAETLSAPDATDASEASPSAEDVLEETPDFLRDTPEQDRLWFEQRPPRDFDFDK